MDTLADSSILGVDGDEKVVTSGWSLGVKATRCRWMGEGKLIEGKRSLGGDKITQRKIQD